MRTIVSVLAALLMLAGCGRTADSELPSDNPAVIRLPVVTGRPGSGYFDLRIAGDHGALLSVTSPEADRIEMHETMMSGTMASMRPIARIPVRDGELLRFAPGGRHLMVYGIRPGVAAGDTIHLVFHFERGGTQQLAAVLRPVGGDI
jgi:copper(I)-binding protein